MKTSRTTRLPIGDIIASFLLSNKKPLCVSGITALTFFFTGLFFSFCLSAPDREALFLPLITMFEGGPFPAAPCMTVNLTLLLLIMLAGITACSMLVSLLLLAMKSLSAGFCTGLIYCASSTGLKFILLSIGPVSLFRLIIFSCACAVCISNSSHILRRQTDEGPSKTYFYIFMILAAAVVLSVLAERFTFFLI